MELLLTYLKEPNHQFIIFDEHRSDYRYYNELVTNYVHKAVLNYNYLKTTEKASQQDRHYHAAGLHSAVKSIHRHTRIAVKDLFTESEWQFFREYRAKANLKDIDPVNGWELDDFFDSEHWETRGM